MTPELHVPNLVWCPNFGGCIWPDLIPSPLSWNETNVFLKHAPSHMLNYEVCSF